MRTLPPATAWTLLRTLTSALGHYDPDAADNSPQANYRKAVRLTAQIGSLVATLGRLATGGGPIEPDPVLGPRGELPLHADRRAAERPRDARVRRRADAARRSRAERVDVRRARRRRDAHRHPLGDRRRRSARSRDRCTAARTPTSCGCCSRSGQDAPAREGGRGRPREAGAQGEDSRLRPPRLPHRGSARDAPAPDVARSRPARRPAEWFEMSQRIEALVKAEKKLNPNVDFYSASTYHALGIADRSVHADLRGQPHLGLDGARARAVREQPADPPARRLHRPRSTRSATSAGSTARSGPRYDRIMWIPARHGSASSATSRSSRTSTTASRRSPTASSS